MAKIFSSVRFRAMSILYKEKVKIRVSEAPEIRPSKNNGTLERKLKSSTIDLLFEYISLISFLADITSKEKNGSSSFLFKRN